MNAKPPRAFMACASTTFAIQTRSADNSAAVEACVNPPTYALRASKRWAIIVSTITSAASGVARVRGAISHTSATSPSASWCGTFSRSSYSSLLL